MAFVAAGQPTLADVRARIKAAGGLANRADLNSALSVVGRALGLPLDAIPAHPKFLQPRLACVPPMAHGLTRARWANVKSLLRKALELSGVATMPGRHTAPLAPDWLRLYRLLTTKSMQHGLSRFAHYCSANHIAPANVDDTFMAEFRKALVAESLVRDPVAVGHRAIKSWNRAAREIPGWPARQLTAPTVVVRAYVLKLDELPATLRQDTEAWLVRLAGAEPQQWLAFRPVRPATVDRRSREVRMLATALVATGRELDAIRSLADLVTVDAAKAALTFDYERAGKRKTSQLCGLAGTIVAIARHWARVPTDQLEQLRALRRQCDPVHKGMTPKNRATLRHFDDEATIQRFLGLPQRIFGQLAQRRSLTRRDATRMQLALAIELLTVAPMRISNLVGLRLDQHLQQIGSGESRVTMIVFAPHEVKNRVELTYPLPTRTRLLLAQYLAKARPQLAAAGTPYMFPGRAVGPKHHGTLRLQIIGLTEREIGVRLTPHQLRHVTGKLLLKLNPGGHEIVRALLGHASISTTTRFYAGTEQADAARHYDRLLAGLR